MYPNILKKYYIYLKTPPLLDRNVFSSTNHTYTAEAKLFSEKVISYWSNFVKNGDPNSFENGYIKTWNKFNGDNYLSFTNKETKMINGGISTHKCRFWDLLPSVITSTTTAPTLITTSITTPITTPLPGNFINSGVALNWNLQIFYCIFFVLFNFYILRK